MKKAIFSFIGGMLLGSVVTWQATKRYYGNVAQKEINDQKQWFENKCASCEKRDGTVKFGMEIKKSDTEKEDRLEDFRAQTRELSEAMGIIEREGYTRYSRQTRERIQNAEISDQPYVISPAEYGELQDYTQVQLTYYMDGIVADEDDRPVNCPEDILGDEFWTHFGEYRDDSLHIRNDIRKCDYELLKSLFTYSEAVGSLNAQVNAE